MTNQRAVKTRGKAGGLAPADAIVLHSSDNVATALRPLRRGIVVRLSGRRDTVEVRLVSAVPFGHKFALRRIMRASRVKKYGACIGRATRKIAAGEHVHTHNIESLRGRGDRR